MTDRREVVVLLHGLGMTGLELLRIRRALERVGFEVTIFRYATVFRSPAANAAILCRRLDTLRADRLHFVAHSLGGIVLTHLFTNCASARNRAGRVLMLGTPLAGSALASWFHRRRLLRWLLGRSLERGLLGDHPPWAGPDALAMISGSYGLGPGLLLPGVLARPHDGTVSIRETQAPEVRQHLTVPYSHTGMLLSARVSRIIARFLLEGHLQD